MSTSKGITYANSQPDLPGSEFTQRLRHLRLTRQFAANSNLHETAPKPHQTKDPSMVAQEHPHPVLKPSPQFAADVDAHSFNARWEAEHRRAARSRHTQSKGNPMSDNDQRSRPAETLREGSLKAAIWRNENDKGTYHSVTLARTYKDRDGNLQDTNSFRSKDMLALSELARRTHHQSQELDRDAFKEQRRTEAQPNRAHDPSRDR